MFEKEIHIENFGMVQGITNFRKSEIKKLQKRCGPERASEIFGIGKGFEYSGPSLVENLLPQISSAKRIFLDHQANPEFNDFLTSKNSTKIRLFYFFLKRSWKNSS